MSTADTTTCRCGHTAHWHSDRDTPGTPGTGECEHDVTCTCTAFAPGTFESVIGLTLPEGTGRAQLSFFAETSEDFERVREQAIGWYVQDRTWYDAETGDARTVCHWTENGIYCSLHAPHGYQRARPGVQS